MNRQFKLKIDGREYSIEVDGNSLLIDEIPFVIGTSGEMVTLDGIAYDVRIEDNKAFVDGREYKIDSLGLRSGAGKKKDLPQKPKIQVSEGSVLSVMPGAIVRILVKEGDIVEPQTVLLILEAMKMENEVQSERNGSVKKVHVKIGDKVEEGQPLVDIK